MDDIEIDGEQMSCPNCKRPLNIDLKAIDTGRPKKDRLGIIALCCGTELECDAPTLIDLLPGIEDRQN